jgi:hypothetical protein
MTKTPAALADLSGIVGLIREALMAEDGEADAAVGIKPGQCVVRFGGKVFEVGVVERKG